MSAMRFENIELGRMVVCAGLWGALCLSLAGGALAAPSKTDGQLHDAWRTAIVRSALPGQGCFTAEYPATAWTEVACTKAPDREYQPAHHPQVGFGNDYAAVASSISE